MKKVAILQSNYIPWKGYFDLINMVDEFVLFDEVQYTKNDWRNRNKIKTSQGLQWLTIPVRQVSLEQKISETMVANAKWNVKHWNSIVQNYSKSKYFSQYRNFFERLYFESNEESLSKINYSFIGAICEILDIRTKISFSSKYQLIDGQTEKLLHICHQAGASCYLSGPAAKEYFDISLAKKMDIDVEWMDYTGYPEYRQLHSGFEHSVSILDLIFNEGPNAKSFMKSFK